MSLTLSDCNSREQKLLAYVADLELEVDRLRKQYLLLEQGASEAIRQIERPCVVASVSSFVQIAAATRALTGLLQDLHEPFEQSPAFDQVVVIAVRPLIEQVFRWQQRVHSAPYTSLHLQLNQERISWFPGRLRHILDNLLSNALRYRVATSGESRVIVALSANLSTYELRVTDNGRGMISETSRDGESPESFHHSSPARSAALGVGLPVVIALIEQSGGSVTQHSEPGSGVSVVATLPRYDVDDFLT
jgi:signal transduction histidine kinase